MTNILGVDIGGVIIDRANDRTDTSFFSDNYLKTTAVVGAFEALRKLTKSFRGKVHIVSKASPDNSVRSWKWLHRNDFFEQTGISPANLHFCLERKHKAPICGRLGITHFVDDKFEVMSYLTNVPNRYMFQPTQRDRKLANDNRIGVIIVDSWPEVVKHIGKLD
jgi:hypothetical protein